jgi:hypothetical protein
MRAFAQRSKLGPRQVDASLRGLVRVEETSVATRRGGTNEIPSLRPPGFAEDFARIPVHPDDPLEQEAGRVADAVVHGEVRPLPTRSGGRTALQRQAKDTPTEEAWTRVYGGEERNLSFDYVVAGISRKSGGRTTSRTVLVRPGETFKPPDGWDLDCFIRRDGTALKFPGVASHLGITMELTVNETRSQFGQYVHEAEMLFRQMPAPAPDRPAVPGVQLFPVGYPSSAEQLPSALGQARRAGPGEQLPERARSFFESRLGHDFSQVRVHTDSRAADAARSIGARAFTVGRDVYFGTGEYRLETTEGQRLIAHELAHVVQQSASRSPAAGASSLEPGAAIQRQPTDRSPPRLSRRAASMSPGKVATSEDEGADALRDLAARPWDALRQWGRLSEPGRSVLVTYMTMRYGVDFARQFLEGARRGSGEEQSIRITNVPPDLPASLAAQGYRLRRSTDRAQYFVHPSGREVWFVLPLSEAQLAQRVRSASAAAEAQRDARALADIQQRLVRLTAERNEIVSRATQLRAHAQEPDAERQADELATKVVDWDQRFSDASDAINSLREATLPEHSEQIDPRLVGARKSAVRSELRVRRGRC